ncbi:Coq4 family protein [uncultured Winogradskyella sp.]|uniref:Coq4 family protein n=1 Tax=uncultured Winogradskyella sp. TaxID=395353 RepID=UPI002615F05E|nr:Coq4 family protein [uncultured Winogradskyella sp.]
MTNKRKQLIIFLFEHSQRLYTAMFKRHESWKYSKNDLLQFPIESFGRHLGEFLNKNNFELIPKVERHDCYHVLCGYSTKVEDEIALQCLCYGNGKRSPYLYGAIILGVAILPDYYNYYYKSYKIGKSANAFHQFDYKKLLRIPIDDLRTSIFSKSQIQNINNNILNY